MHNRTAEWQSDNGKAYTFGTGNALLGSITDSAGAEEYTIKAPGQDGVTTCNLALGRLSVSLSASIHAPYGSLDERRCWLDNQQDILCQAFSPNRFGLLVDNRAGVRRKVRCRPVGKPVFGVPIQGSCTVDIDFISDMPKWETADEMQFPLGREVGGFRFPLRLPTRMGTYAKKAKIQNETGDDIYPLIEIFTTSQMILLRNETTGKYIEINRPILTGQKMTIDTADTTAFIWEERDGLWGEYDNASNWLSGASEYWPLCPGENIVTISNERKDEFIIANIRYNEPI